jgi:cobalt/nickel transport system ATP-binding protein
MSGPLLELNEVSYRYPDGSVGLNDCSLVIRHGSRNVLIGANGSGKTTLFQHGNALLRPRSGVVRYAGLPVDYSRGGLRELRSKVGMVFQNPDRQLFSASVQEDVSFGPLNLGLDMTTVRQRVAHALQAVGMAAHTDKAVHNLSFGQKKRVCIAGVLAMAPELLILDEPMAGLDHAMQAELLIVLDDLHARGITLLLATHDIDFAYRWADRIHLMAGGRCTASLNAPELGNHAAALADIGLPLPEIIGLHRALAARGLLSDESAPRCSADLLAMLAATTNAKENLCNIA